jgi:PAS domain S-box-containing protein
MTFPEKSPFPLVRGSGPVPELLQALERVALMLDSMTDRFFALDRDWRYTYFNKPADEQLQAFGKNPASLIGKTLWEEFPNPPVEDVLRRVMNDRVAVTDEHYYPPLREWVENRIFPTPDGGLAIFQRYITDRKRAEEQLRASEERFRRYFDLGLIGMAITSPTNGCLEVNDELCRILGYERHALLRMTWAEITHPEDLAADVTQFDRVMAGEIDGYSMDKRWIRRDGQVIHSIMAAQCVRRTDASVEYFVGLVQDITQRKLAEDELRRSQAYLAEGQRLTHTGSWAWNVATDALYWSVEHFRIFGRDPAQVTPSYQELLRWVHPDDRARVERTVDEALRGRCAYELDWRIVCPDGAVKDCHTVAHPVFDESGQVTEYVGTIMDVTERNRGADTLQAAHRELAHVTRLATLGGLTTSLAHELNQPLAAIVTHASACVRWLDRAEPNLDEAMRGAQRIIQAAMQASGVIGNMRAFLKKSAGEKTACDIAEEIRNVRGLVEVELANHQVIVHEILAPNLPSVPCVRVELEQVLLNLIMNGIEAMASITARPRELVIRAGPYDLDGQRGVLVSVQDAGVGITAHSGQLFEPFYTTKPQGLGMGLSISRSIVESQGGKLWATANADHGATFQFILPMEK